MTLVERSRLLEDGTRATWTEEKLPGGVVRFTSTSGHGLHGFQFRFCSSIALVDAEDRSESRSRLSALKPAPRRPRVAKPAPARHLEFGKYCGVITRLRNWDGLEDFFTLEGVDYGGTIVVRYVGESVLRERDRAPRAIHNTHFDTWLEVERTRTDGLHLIGSLHTHPQDGTLEPSETDLHSWESQRQLLGLESYVGAISSIGFEGYSNPSMRAWSVERGGITPLAIHFLC